jgi:hypothetical protein
MDGPDSVCLGLFEDRPLGQGIRPCGIWNQGHQFKSQLCQCLATVNCWREVKALTADMSYELTVCQAHLLLTTAPQGICY